LKYSQNDGMSIAESLVVASQNVASELSSIASALPNLEPKEESSLASSVDRLAESVEDLRVAVQDHKKD